MKKNHSSVKTGSVGNNGLLPHAKMLLDFFSLVGRLCSGGKRFDWANVDCKTVGFFSKSVKKSAKCLYLNTPK